jgi:hypothetical protein
MRDAEKHRRYIANPTAWRHFVCPLVNRRHPFAAPESAAYLLTGPRPDGSITMFIGNIFSMSNTDTAVVFPSVDALLDAGYEVD